MLTGLHLDWTQQDNLSDFFFIEIQLIFNIVLVLAMECSRRSQWQLTPVLLPGKSHGWRSLVGYCPQGHKESDTTEQREEEEDCFSSKTVCL